MVFGRMRHPDDDGYAIGFVLLAMLYIAGMNLLPCAISSACERIEFYHLTKPLIDVGVLAFFHSLFVIVVGPLLAGAGIGALLAKAGKAT
jgi:hypothetical protein